MPLPYGVGTFTFPGEPSQFGSASAKEMSQLLQQPLLSPTEFQSLPERVRSAFQNYRNYAASWRMRKDAPKAGDFYRAAKYGSPIPERTGPFKPAAWQPGPSVKIGTEEPGVRRYTDIQGWQTWQPTGRAATPEAEYAAQERIPRIDEQRAAEQESRRSAEYQRQVAGAKRATISPQEAVKMEKDVLAREKETRMKDALQKKADLQEARLEASAERQQQKFDHVKEMLSERLTGQKELITERGKESERLFRARMKLGNEYAVSLWKQRRDESRDREMVQRADRMGKEKRDREVAIRLADYRAISGLLAQKYRSLDGRLKTEYDSDKKAELESELVALGALQEEVYAEYLSGLRDTLGDIPAATVAASPAPEATPVPEFATVEEAEAANLPPGTEVIIAGRRAIVE